MIRVAILGAGIGAQHLDAYRDLPKFFKVTMIVDQDAMRAKAIAGAKDVRIETDMRAAFDSRDVDLIDICLPPHLHVPTTLEALKAGKHVVCEKPLATNLADIDRIRAAAAQAGRRVFPVFQYRWGPSLARLRALIGAGLTGRANIGAIETHWSRGAGYYAIPWRGTWAGEQGGAVLGHAIHNHDLMTHFMGRVEAVSAMTATRVNPIETEDCAALIFRMVGGSLCTSSITLGAGFDRTRIRLVFENLTATSGSAPYAPGSDDWEFVARDPDTQPKIDAIVTSQFTDSVGFSGFFLEISKALAGDAHTAVTLDQGADSIELVTAIYHAARTGERVSLPLARDHPLYEGWLP